MGLLRGIGSMRFKWAVSKVLFPQLTGTNRKSPRARGVPIYPAGYFAPTTSEERDWIASFDAFCSRVDQLIHNSTKGTNRQLFLLLTAFGGISEQYSSLFEGAHSKAFLEAEARVAKKARQLLTVVKERVTLAERKRIVEETGGKITIDPNTWWEVSSTGDK